MSKKFDWKDTNVELIGSSEDRSVKKSSAETEKAWDAAKACSKPDLFVWRIEKFKVVEWPRESYGEFYEGDSYIVLNIYKLENDLLYDLHFWIGKYSTQDEYGTAAYKTVELDTLLDDKPIQHREVQEYESDLFKNYFQKFIYLKGGCESGFRHVDPSVYIPRLLHVRGEKKHIVVSQVSATRKNLDSSDVFIYDTGFEIFQWIGKGANKDEKYRAAQFSRELVGDRFGRGKIEVLDEDSVECENDFYKFLSNDDPEEEDHKRPLTLERHEKQLFRISDVNGALNFDWIASEYFTESDITEEDVFIIDNGQTLFVYIGEHASCNEKKNALIYAHNYLKETQYPQAPVTVIRKCDKGPNAEYFKSIVEG